MSGGFTFTRATKDAAKARIALAGPSGSGKTYTALKVAAELAAGRDHATTVALIDTERGSASKYSTEFQFDTLQLDHFEPQTLVQILAAAGAADYEVVIVDSLSHFWFGKGGMLQQVDNASKRASGNSFAGWKEARPLELAMVDALLAYPGHVIVTMRTKTEWVIEKDERTGKNAPRKIGTKPEQREGIEYEFDIVGDLDQENTLIVSKSRCPALARAVVQQPGEEFAQQIRDWLSDGKPTPSALDYRERAVAADATREDLLALYKEVEGRQLLGAAVMNSDSDGSTTLGELIVARGKEAAAEAEK